MHTVSRKYSAYIGQSDADNPLDGLPSGVEDEERSLDGAALEKFNENSKLWQ